MAGDAVIAFEQQRSSRFFPEYRKCDDEEYGDTHGHNDNIFFRHSYSLPPLIYIAGWIGIYSRMIAVTGQLSTVCWQSQASQPFALMTHALSSFNSKTLGQSSEHSPHPIQRSRSIRGVAMMIFILSSVFDRVGGLFAGLVADTTVSIIHRVGQDFKEI
jgi:hypothetical protein